MKLLLIFILFIFIPQLTYAKCYRYLKIITKAEVGKAKKLNDLFFHRGATEHSFKDVAAATAFLKRFNHHFTELRNIRKRFNSSIYFTQGYGLKNNEILILNRAYDYLLHNSDHLTGESWEEIFRSMELIRHAPIPLTERLIDQFVNSSTPKTHHYVSVGHSLARLGLRHPKFIGKFQDKLIYNHHHLNLEEIIDYLWSMATMDPLFDEAEGEFYDSMGKILNRRLATDHFGEIWTGQMNQLHFLVENEFLINLNRNWMKRIRDSISFAVTVTRYQREIEKVLQGMGLKPQMEYEIFGKPFDIFVEYQGKKILIEVNGPQHGMRNGQQTGPEAAYRHIAKEQGYLVVYCTNEQWKKMKSRASQEAFLMRLLTFE